MENSHKFFRNTDCRYFPCHVGIAAEAFNCLFCFCPLYHLGAGCDGKFKYDSVNGNIKNCTDCNLPHMSEFYGTVIDKIKEFNHEEV